MNQPVSEKQSRIASKGLLDILMALEGGEKSFTELKALKFSPNTILLRLREAQKMDLVDQRLFEIEGRRPRIKYALTKEGKEMLQIYQSIRGRYKELNAELQSLKKEVKKKEKEMKYLLSSNSRESS